MMVIGRVGNFCAKTGCETIRPAVAISAAASDAKCLFMFFLVVLDQMLKR